MKWTVLVSLGWIWGSPKVICVLLHQSSMRNSGAFSSLGWFENPTRDTAINFCLLQSLVWAGVCLLWRLQAQQALNQGLEFPEPGDLSWRTTLFLPERKGPGLAARVGLLLVDWAVNATQQWPSHCCAEGVPGDPWGNVELFQMIQTQMVSEN